MLKKILATTLLLVAHLTTSSAIAKDFWGTYGNNLAYNYSVKDDSQHQTQHDQFNIISKSFSQTFVTRFKEISKERSFLGFICAFSKTPEKCFVDPVSKSLFDEIGFINAPEVSDKNIKRMVNFAFSDLSTNSFSKKKSIAQRTPRHRAFNLRLGYDLQNREVVASTPFYTYFGVNIQPKYKSNTGFSVGIIQGRWTADIYPKDIVVQYNIKNPSVKKKYITISYNSDNKFVNLSNTVITW